MAGHPTFAEAWADLSVRLDATLVRRGVPRWLKDDVVQETGLRLLKVWDDLDHDRPLLPLAYTIARNLVADEIRRNRNLDMGDEVEEASDEFVTERAGLARLELRQVEKAMGSLTEKQRAVLLADLGVGPPPEMGPDAIKMARMRARRTLLALLAGATRLHGAVLVNWKRLFRAAEVTLAPREGTGAAAGALVAAAVLATTWSAPPRWSQQENGAAPSAVAPGAVTVLDPMPMGMRTGGMIGAPPDLRNTGASDPQKPAAANSAVSADQQEPEESPPSVEIGGHEARAGMAVRVFGMGTHAGDQDQDSITVCADHDRFRVATVGDEGCHGTVLQLEGGGEVRTHP
ncbi:MAG TPA: sigma-70 family RNA polymerase sigma factor [Actinomycetota bacterium]|jgi:RNA polymerase sigma factor (sigma-70 family)|nr:sigma-70 family RNA polymerase sigma factor [Actinomycetota bacterium]